MRVSWWSGSVCSVGGGCMASGCVGGSWWAQGTHAAYGSYLYVPVHRRDRRVTHWSLLLHTHTHTRNRTLQPPTSPPFILAMAASAAPRWTNCTKPQPRPGGILTYTIWAC